MSHIHIKVLCSLAGAILLCSSAFGQNGGLRFTLTDLGTFGGISSEAKAINNRGQVVGTFATPKGPMCFLWQQGVAPITFNGDTFCDLLAVGPDGTAAGTMQITKYGSALVAFRRDPSGSIRILTPLPGGGNSWGFGVAKKTVVGKSAGQAVRWDSYGNVTAIGSGPSEAIGINSNLQIVGWAIDSVSMLPQSWLWQNGNLTNLPPLSRGQANFAWAINDNAFTVGADVVPNMGMCPALWQGAAVTTFPCVVQPNWAGQHQYAVGISSDNWIVATGVRSYAHDICFYINCGSYLSSVLIVPDPSCSPTDFNSLLDVSSAAWAVQGIWGINDQHQVVGYGRLYGNGQPHAILLTPNNLPLCYPT